MDDWNAMRTKSNMEHYPKSILPLTRRDFLAGTGALVLSSAIPKAYAEATSASLGHWFEDDHGLPGYQYTGPMRFPDSPREGSTILLHDDPYFMLGNYRLTLFTHASGLYEILSGESIWARLNCGEALWSGENHASVDVAGETVQLVGIDEPAAIAATKQFGVGFARYGYKLPKGLEVVRKLSVAPSHGVKDGSSAFLVQVTLKNSSSGPLDFKYTETTRANYQPVLRDGEKISVAYTKNAPRHLDEHTVLTDFAVHPSHPLTFPPAGQRSDLEQHPAALFVRSLESVARPIAGDNIAGHPSLGVECKIVLQPGEQREISFLVGYTRDVSPAAVALLVAKLRPGADMHHEMASAFAPAWSRVVPAFAAEKDPALRREMRWNVAVLEAMATWRSYYDETVIPQGTMYDYQWGRMMSSRDIAQQALPFCHTNPAIARSSLRWLMKRMTPDGEIKLNDQGFGYAESSPQYTSDQQLYFFLLLAEYLRVTRDATILTEEVEFYPRDTSVRETGLDHVRRGFLFLRDQIGVGWHGIVRRWNSDWNDMFFWWPTNASYNIAWLQGESHMNSTMLVVIFGDLAGQIEALHPATELTAAMREYREQIYQALLKDMGDRSFSRRAWTDPNTALGDKDMWLEPQGYALLIPEFPVERKRKLFEELQSRLLAGEAMGARQMEQPSTHTGTPGGTRENGGFWYALHGPLVLGVATFDATTAESLLDRMTLANFTKRYPEYWTGQWSASDSLNSSRLPTGGLSIAMPYCAHAHAWPLYCYLRLTQQKNHN
jgi:cellobiose phosphorylase